MPKTLPVVDLSGALCCPPVARGELTEPEAMEAALRLKALADPVRLQIVSILIQQDSRGARNLDLAERLGLSDATISHHLGVLHRAGLVLRERGGGVTVYRVDRGMLGALAGVIDPACC